MVASVSYIAAGSLHFIKPAAYLGIMPPHIPWQPAMVRGSAGLRDPRRDGSPGARHAPGSGLGLVALLIAVFSGQYLHGDASGRGPRRLDRTVAQVRSASPARAPDRVADAVVLIFIHQRYKIERSAFPRSIAE
jgi:hypothetical protein